MFFSLKLLQVGWLVGCKLIVVHCTMYGPPSCFPYHACDCHGQALKQWIIFINNYMSWRLWVHECKWAWYFWL